MKAESDFCDSSHASKSSLSLGSTDRRPVRHRSCGERMAQFGLESSSELELS